MERLIRDLRFGLRLLLKSPGFTLISVLALGLGIGSVVTQFTVLNGAYFKGLPFEDAHELVHLERINLERDRYNTEVPIPEFLEWRKQQDSFEDLAGFYMGTVNLTMDGIARRYDGAFISCNAIELLGAKAHLGRALEPDDSKPESPDVAVISYGVWINDFGANPSVIGQSVIINSRTVTIVGVMEKGFAFPIGEDVWVPLSQQQDIPSIKWGDDQVISLEVFGRLKEGMDLDRANANMNAIVQRIESAHPESNEGFRAVEVKPYIEEFLGNQTFVVLAMMLVVTILILLIACTNVANLLFARSIRRSKELAIRSALGATRQGMIRQLITESILLAFLGSLLGLALSSYNLQAILRQKDSLNMPFWFNFESDWRIMAVVAIVTISTGVLSGLIPALRASRQDFNEILKDDTRIGTSLQQGWFIRMVVIGQVTLSCVILVIVILMIRSFHAASEMEYGYDAKNTLSARMGLFEGTYPDDAARSSFIRELTQRLENRPEVGSVGFTNRYRFLNAYRVEYETSDQRRTGDEAKVVPVQAVTEGFAEATRLEIFGGRFFTVEDRQPDANPVVVVNRFFVEREWPEENAIGKRIQIIDPQLEKPLWATIVGVVGSMIEQGIDGDHDGAAIMVPMKDDKVPAFITMVAGGSLSPGVRLPIIREEISKLDNNLPLYAVGTPEELIREDTRQFEFISGIFTRFGLLAVFLSAIGIYGVIMFSVHQRTPEYGVRQALGATPIRVFQHVYRSALYQLLTGFGIALLLLSPLYLLPNMEDILANIFFEANPDDLINYIFAFGIVGTVLLVAVLPPAFRASRILPAKALRHD